MVRRVAVAIGGANVTWFRVQGSGFGVQGSRCRVQGSGFRPPISAGGGALPNRVARPPSSQLTALAARTTCARRRARM